ncbi:MAG: hypothetical protein IGQ88_05760 [Gloeomargaritaceae cyanobacterium C42_A2020_066]|nr:hypothetical protein [Gloeomargaritaceae cyanobacterium C42_A2020_066]
MASLIGLFAEEAQTERAYTALVQAGISPTQITLIGPTHQSLATAGLVDPKEQAQRRARAMALWLVPFGFGSGLGFSLLVNLNTFAWAGPLGNHLVGALLGAVGGGLGGLFMGGGIAVLNTEPTYRQRLAQGQGLVLIRTGLGQIRIARQALTSSKPLEIIESLEDETL